MDAAAGTVVIEDDVNIALLLELYLQRERFRVVITADGEAGVDLVTQERPRLVVLDPGTGRRGRRLGGVPPAPAEKSGPDRDGDRPQRRG